METIKKNTIILLTLIICSCSSNDSNNDKETNGNNVLTINDDNYELTNAYIKRNELGNNAVYSILLSSGAFVDLDSNPVKYTNNFKHGLGLVVKVPLTDNILNTITYNFDTDGANTVRYLSTIGFNNNYVIENNMVQSFNVVFTQDDVIEEQARVIVTELGNGEYNFSFNAVTALGVINCNYKGSVVIEN
ncbi:hypothetical protein [Thalassobellus citreus]|uniref:hypothetical protein n=1 Tax=Thalassobellus citreus TaxID=3367752 RepID=UPI0037ACE575